MHLLNHAAHTGCEHQLTAHRIADLRKGRLRLPLEQVLTGTGLALQHATVDTVGQLTQRLLTIKAVTTGIGVEELLQQRLFVLAETPNHRIVAPIGAHLVHPQQGEIAVAHDLLQPSQALLQRVEYRLLFSINEDIVAVVVIGVAAARQQVLHPRIILIHGRCLQPACG